jgi:hypothetical protein
MACQALIRPTYDRSYYLARSQAYARDAAHEPDPAVRSALLALVQECRKKAGEGGDPASPTTAAPPIS